MFEYLSDGSTSQALGGPDNRPYFRDSDRFLPSIKQKWDRLQRQYNKQSPHVRFIAALVGVDDFQVGLKTQQISSQVLFFAKPNAEPGMITAVGHTSEQWWSQLGPEITLHKEWQPPLVDGLYFNPKTVTLTLTQAVRQIRDAGCLQKLPSVLLMKVREEDGQLRLIYRIHEYGEEINNQRVRVRLNTNASDPNPVIVQRYFTDQKPVQLQIETCHGEIIRSKFPVPDSPIVPPWAEERNLTQS